MPPRLYQPSNFRVPHSLHQRLSLSSHPRLFTTEFQYPWKKRRRAPQHKRVIVYKLPQWKDAPTLPPPYPYEQSQKLFKQSNTGLYGGLRVKFGNKVSAKNKIKTRRTWHPHIVHKRLYSVALDRMLMLKVATRVLRTVDKAGGLDEYLLGSTASRMRELGEEGWRLRWVILQALKDSERVRGDPRLMLELQSGTPRDGVWRREDALVGTTVDVPMPRGTVEDGEDETAEERRRRRDEEIEEAIQTRLEEDRLMREEPPSVSVLQRASQTITRPIRRLLGRR